MLNDRRRIVLSALVEEYIRSAQPVASRALVDRYQVGCSSATVRSDLAALEETGYLFQPHVSAGRVPTDTGYRAFVDGIGGVAGASSLTPEEAEAVRSCYVELESQISDLMRQTSAVLSRLTSYVAVVLAPALERSRIRRVDLVSLTPRRALVVVITEAGRVADRPLELPEDVGEERVRDAETRLNAALAGKRAGDVHALRSVEAAKGAETSALQVLVLDAVVECIREADAEQVHHGGTAALLAQPEFADSRSVQPLLGLLEDGFAMLQVLSEALSATDVVVRIGSENRAAGLEHASLVATNYGSAGSEGIVGLIGPTRMDYSRAIGAVRCVADELSDALG